MLPVHRSFDETPWLNVLVSGTVGFAEVIEKRVIAEKQIINNAKSQSLMDLDMTNLPWKEDALRTVSTRLWQLYNSPLGDETLGSTFA